MKNNRKEEEWLLEEDEFDAAFLGKGESVFCLGNGYLGLRSATEEKYSKEQRGLFVAGTFNKSNDNEVTEIPNAADVTAMDFTFNKESFSLEKGIVHAYHRSLDLKTGELSRKILWESPKKEYLEIIFSRVVSFRDLHLIAQKVVIRPLTKDTHWELMTGIDGRMTNSGAGHFTEGEKRLAENRYLQYVQTTIQSKIDFVLSSVVSGYKDNQKDQQKQDVLSTISVKNDKFSHGESVRSSKAVDFDRISINMSRRRMLCSYAGEIKKGESITIEKISNLFTLRDREPVGTTSQEILMYSLWHVKEAEKLGYEFILQESAKAWDEKIWNRAAIKIQSENPTDQLAIRFSQYHLAIMAPSQDERINVGAKGLSGEGYKGHTFWDSDIFVLPYFTFTFPEIARNLEKYRYLSLQGAHDKAISNGFRGAQYPWESAWIEDGEVTPAEGDVDIVTGEPQKIWTGLIEQHITSDVVYGIWQYMEVTGDEEFMEQYGYEVIFDTAVFWNDRLEYDISDDGYHIRNVIGPDEYKEHVNDNAYTNYMAHWNIGLAIKNYEHLQKDKAEIFEKLNLKLSLEAVYVEWKNKIDRIFLPKARRDGVIAQDETYLTLKEIELQKYKDQDYVLGIYKDYNADQINEIQVSKQADILALLYLMEDSFPEHVIKANWDYYEPKTLHDSSLSFSTHCILANDLGEKEKAYILFQEACKVDLGPNVQASESGVHAAALGGIWQSVIFGFGGVRIVQNKLRINPSLPKCWNELQFSIMWRGLRLDIRIDHKNIFIKKSGHAEKISLEVAGNNYTVEEVFEVQYIE